MGVETDRGLLVQALVASGYAVCAINPFAASRYPDRHVTSGAKSDRGDAKVLADLVRTDRHHHRRVAGDSVRAEAIKILARAHQRLIWARQRHLNGLRSALREFYPGALAAFGTDLVTADALAVLGHAPTPSGERGLRRGTLERLLRAGGRQRRVTARAIEIQAALRVPQLEADPTLTAAHAAIVRATVRIIAELNAQVTALEAELTNTFEQHADAGILESLPGLGPVLGARCWLSSGTTRPASWTPRPARPTPAPPPSPAPQAPATPCSRGWRATATWLTPATAGPTPPSAPRPAVVRTTMPIALAARRIPRPSARSRIAWSAFSTVASSAASPTRRPSPGRALSNWPPETTSAWLVLVGQDGSRGEPSVVCSFRGSGRHRRAKRSGAGRAAALTAAVGRSPTFVRLLARGLGLDNVRWWDVYRYARSDRALWSWVKGRGRRAPIFSGSPAR